MENILENIWPVIGGVIYVLVTIFAKKNKTDATKSKPLQDHELKAEEKESQQRVQPRNHTQPITDIGRQTPPPIPNLSRQHQQAESENSNAFSWDQSDDTYDTDREALLKKIEATKREALRLQSQTTQKRIQAQGETDNPQKTPKKSSLGSVRSSLKDPQAARSAFIYGEVLGPPVSLRKGTGIPGLTS